MAEGLNSATKKMKNYAEIIEDLKAKGVASIYLDGTDPNFERYLTSHFQCDNVGCIRAHLNEPMSIERRLKRMTHNEAKELFLTDDNLHDETDYNGWQISFDNQTGAVYFYDPKSLLELYCSPSFEGEWGKIVFCLSSEYNFEDGYNTREVDEIFVLDLAGNIEAQRTKWRAMAHAIIDDITHHVKEYDDMVLKTTISNAVYNSLGNVKMHTLLTKDREAYARITFLKESLIKEILNAK